MSFPWLSILVLGPILVGLGLLFANPGGRAARTAGFGVTGLTLALTILISIRFQPESGFQLVERYDWLPAIGLEYHLALDGISLVFVFLTGLVFLMSLAASARQADGRYFALLILLQGGLLGTFTAQNFLHFFLFWELSLIPAFFLVRKYGGAGSSRAAIQFFVYTMVGSIAMLLAFLAIYLATGTFDLVALSRVQERFGTLLVERAGLEGLGGDRLSVIIFILAFLGVAVKVPLWPLHSWLPITYTEAPTPVTMALTGVMSKMGVYGLIRLIYPLFPAEINALREPLLTLAVITILYGALAAFAQSDLKRLFAYSSLSHLGYCFLGVFAAASAGAGLGNDRAAALNGVVLQVLSHGIIGAALFGFISFLENRNGGLRSIELFGGLRKVTPQFAGLMGVALFASLGLPGLSGFPAEFLIFKGAFTLAPLATSFAVIGLLLTALYLLTFFGRVFLGPLAPGNNTVRDLTFGEKGVVFPAIAGAFILGIAPQVAIYFFNPSITRLVEELRF